VPVDAIPDLGENQQIVFTEWPGRSPQDVDDQITYPLTVALLGLPEVSTVRSYSYFGFSSIYIIFQEKTDFYDSRSRVLEKLGSLSEGTLPDGVKPALGPDATALGQVFWYTLEGRDAEGEPAGGWDPAELRNIQDYYVRDALLASGGVAEVASVGGFQQEYQVEVDPDLLLHFDVSLPQVVQAVGQSNLDTGARSLEINRVEYVVRGVGAVAGVQDLENSVVALKDRAPVLLRDVATVQMGPALRRGALDKEGAEAVGGVVVVRYGENPLRVIEQVKTKIAEIAPSLPVRTLSDGRESRVTIVPFYDRTTLIHETLDTLAEALSLEILLTILVVLVMVRNLRGGLLVAGLLPLAVLFCFIAMKVFKVDANIVALSGIAIAIGTMVDMGVILVENILRRREIALSESATGSLDTHQLGRVIHRATVEVAGAILTAVTTTVLSFLPVFTLIAAEGKLFRPLAFTKTFALLASVLIALVVIPVAAHLLFRVGRNKAPAAERQPGRWGRWLTPHNLLIMAVVGLLTWQWHPLGLGRHYLWNLLFVVLLVFGVLFTFKLFQQVYPRLLGWCLDHKPIFLVLPVLLLGSGLMIFPRLGQEFMPPLDEGSFLYMPTTMPHASIGEAQDVLAKLDLAIGSIPEVEQVVGKLGRARSALDPAPISMVETVINYKPEYGRDAEGKRVRLWRDHIRTEADIWQEIVDVAQLPGTTSAPRLQPIAARLVMLQSGMRAPMGVKIKGPSLEAIETAALQIEKHLKDLSVLNSATVIADRVVGKPYLELVIDRVAIARHGLTIGAVQRVIQTAIGGQVATTVTEGRERRNVLVRYARERRDDLDAIKRILVTGSDGVEVPLGDLVTVSYVRGPMTIKSEDTFLVGYVIFDRARDLAAEMAEVEVVEAARSHLDQRRDEGSLVLPPGVSYVFAGSFENQVRSEKTLRVVLPVALLLIFVVLYLQFKSVSTSVMVFAGVFVAWSGGFLMLWLYGQPWFLDIPLAGLDLRQIFHIAPVNLSVAVWVGFLALFGIATDDGVLMATYLDLNFKGKPRRTRDEVRLAVITAATRRVRPALMTTATTLLALLPVLTLTGRGSDIMIPMAIPTFGGMTVAMITLFTVPVLYAWREERGTLK
jgi:Cu(I)/Ag(I) efflux system membrane protein CusA/SilA